MNDKEKAIFISIGLAALETVRAEEIPRTARYTRLDRAMDKIIDLVDIYRPEAWSNEQVNKAAKIVDSMNRKIKKEFRC